MYFSLKLRFVGNFGPIDIAIGIYRLRGRPSFRSHTQVIPESVGQLWRKPTILAHSRKREGYNFGKNRQNLWKNNFLCVKISFFNFTLFPIIVVHLFIAYSPPFWIIVLPNTHRPVPFASVLERYTIRKLVFCRVLLSGLTWCCARRIRTHWWIGVGGCAMIHSQDSGASVKTEQWMWAIWGS